MEIEEQQVKEFMMKSGQYCPFRPMIPDKDTRYLRVSLIQEELDELDLALSTHDLVEAADAIADLLYVVLGTAVACGIKIQPIWDEVHRSNMTKFIDGHKNADGKWVKGPSYTPANLGPIIAEQLLKDYELMEQQMPLLD